VVSYDMATGKGFQDYDIGHEVFTLGQGRGWEATQDPPHAVGFHSRSACVGPSTGTTVVQNRY
jgi:hypothetical protein